MPLNCYTGLRGRSEENRHKRRIRERAEYSFDDFGPPAKAKRRRNRPLRNLSSDTSSSTRTSLATMKFTVYIQPRQLLRCLNEQRSDEASCDVSLRSSSPETSSVYAHRCILAASSDYFKAFFRHSLADARVIEIVIPESSRDAIENVVTFVYTGVIEISDVTVEEIVHLADYLGLSKILELCETYMKQNLNDSNCLKFKVLSEFYPLGTLANSVQNYILPRMSALVRSSDAVDLSAEALRQLLSDKETNYAREADVLNLVQDVIASREEVDQVEREGVLELMDCVEFELLPPEVIERQVFSNAETLDWLRARPELLERLRGMVERDQSPGCDVVEAILCQGQTSRAGDDLQLMLYLIRDDVWRVLRQPRDEHGLGLGQRIEAMVVHEGFLYALSSHVLDLTCYAHMVGLVDTTKLSFNRLNLQTGAWLVLPSPSLVTGPATLISVGPDCLLAMDGWGRVERYVTEDWRWTDYCCTGFNVSDSDILRFLPMPTDGKLFALQFGISFHFSQSILSIYRLDNDPSDRGGHSWCRLSPIDNVAAGRFDSNKVVNFCGFSADGQLLLLKDELGHIRAQFDTTLAKWTTLPRRVDRPRFISEIYGMAECPSGVYFVASTLHNDNAFLKLDNDRRRFKMTHAPPYAVSCPLCHVTLSTSFVESVCREE